ncbi:MAG: ADOP family duplicated permease [Thermoanaerobaculia bacterium]
MSQLAHDLRAAIRNIRRRPLIPIVVVTILALGLAACVAVFTYINGFQQSFPGVEARGLVRVFEVEPEEPYQDISYLDFLDYAAANSSAGDGVFAGLAAAQAYYAASVRHATETGVAFLEAVSGDYFRVLEIEMGIGRGLVVDDDRPGADPVAVLSHSWWQRSFGGEASVLGSTLYLNNRPFTIVGVAAPSFLGSTSDTRPNVWIPIEPFQDRYTSWAALAEDRNIPLIRVFGRLRTGVRKNKALEQLALTAAGLDEAYPGRTAPRRLRVGTATWIDPRDRLAELPTLRLMMVTAGGLLLLTYANVANLLLSVALRKQQELAMRAALGASSGRLLRQVLTESVLLSTIAGAIALLLAGPLSTRLGSYFARPSVWGANVSREVSVDLRVVFFALVISILTGLVAGLLPALRASRRSLMPALQSDSVMSGGGHRRLWGHRLPGVHDLLVSSQVALSVVLLVVAGLALRTLSNVSSLDPGFSYDSLVGTHISTSSTQLKPEGREEFFRELRERLSEEPWVQSVTIADNAPLSPQRSGEMRVEGQSDLVTIVQSKVVPGFFDTLQVEVLGGRSFLDTDTADAPDVAVINEELARRFFAGREAVGGRLWQPDPETETEREFEIVGVVRNAKPEDFIAEPPAVVYFPYAQQRYPTGSALLVSTNLDPTSAVPILYQWLRDFEPFLAIVNVLPYSEVVQGFLYTQRMNAEMFSALAFLGLALAAIGIFSVVSLAVSRRRREIGVRMALGARRSDIGGLILHRALTPVILGLGLGLVVSLWVTRLVRGLLYGVEPADPVSLAGGAVVLVMAALLAAYFPTHRAATVDPVAALRNE